MESGAVRIVTAGGTSPGAKALAAIRTAGPGELSGARMIAYDGGNPAVIAAASGEFVAKTQLAVEQTEMILACPKGDNAS